MHSDTAFKCIEGSQSKIKMFKGGFLNLAKVFVNKRKVITTTSDVVTEEVVTEAVRLHMSKLVKKLH